MSDRAWELYSSVLRCAEEGRSEFVHGLDMMIQTGAWRLYRTPDGALVEYGEDDFCRFVEAEPFRGLGLSPATLEGLCKDSRNPAAAERVFQAYRASLPEANPVGTNRFSLSDTQARTQEARDAASVVSRLKRDDPQLAAEVVEGKITPNAAAVKAGIRHKYARIRTDDPKKAVAKLLEHYDRDAVLKALGVAK